MAEKEYIEREAFVEQKRKQYCEDCNRRKGFKRGQYKILYEIGEAPCRACEIDDMLNDVEDFPAADVRPVKRGHWVKRMEEHATTKYTSFTPIWSCSECGLEYDPALAPRIHFCYNCGADMRELQNG